MLPNSSGNGNNPLVLLFTCILLLFYCYLIIVPLGLLACGFDLLRLELDGCLQLRKEQQVEELGVEEKEKRSR